MMKKNNQKGAALILGMVLLLVLSTLVITAMKTALMQEKMASTLKNSELADSAALSMLVATERYLYNYYSVGNNTNLDTGSQYVIAPRTQESRDFRSERDMSNGFANIGGESINAKYDNLLHDEPRFLIEDLSEGNSFYAPADGEFDGHSAGSSGGDSSENNQNRIKLFRVVSKANDTTGNIYAGFESVMSVRTK